MWSEPVSGKISDALHDCYQSLTAKKTPIPFVGDFWGRETSGLHELGREIDLGLELAEEEGEGSV